MPVESRFSLVSNRALMRLVSEGKRPFLFLFANELADQFAFNGVCVFLQKDGVPIVLLFYTRSGMPSTVNIDSIFDAVRVLKT